MRAINLYAQLEKENNISLLGGTHYSSEKFACIEMYKEKKIKGRCKK